MAFVSDGVHTSSSLIIFFCADIFFKFPWKKTASTFLFLFCASTIRNHYLLLGCHCRVYMYIPSYILALDGLRPLPWEWITIRERTRDVSAFLRHRLLR